VDKKLYVVTVETEIVVVAESREKAVEVAQAGDWHGYEEYDYKACEMTWLPGGWTGDAIPYSGGLDDGECDRDLDEWIDLGAAETFKANREARLKRLEKAQQRQASPSESEGPK
jgi:hypothetical protein